VAELLALCKFDWLVVDTEHSPIDLNDVIGRQWVMQGLSAGQAEALGLRSARTGTSDRRRCEDGPTDRGRHGTGRGRQW
jgi:hypothetical protein